MKNNKQKIKKILVLIPFALIPIAAGIFWITKNYNKPSSFQDVVSNKNAFNDKLPEANINDKEKTKLEIYMQAKKDSVAKQEQLSNEELQKKYYDPGPPENKLPENEKKQKMYALKNNVLTTDANELRVNEHLQKLYAQLDNNNPKNGLNKNLSDIPRQASNEDVQRLERMLTSAQKTDTSKDAELNQIDTMLNKMLDITHPERLNNRSENNKPSKPNFYYTVSLNPNPDKDSVQNSDEFYGLDMKYTNPKEEEENKSTIIAIIHEDKWVHDGASVKMRLLQDVYVNGICIPRGNFIYGQCALANDRVTIVCRNISFKNIIYPISLNVYDLDGIEGVNAPGAIGTETTKEGINQGLQNMQLLNLDPSIGAQAANAGVQTAKSLLNKKIKTVKVKLKANHNVLLKTSNI